MWTWKANIWQIDQNELVHWNKRMEFGCSLERAQNEKRDYVGKIPKKKGGVWPKPTSWCLPTKLFLAWHNIISIYHSKWWFFLMKTKNVPEVLKCKINPTPFFSIIGFSQTGGGSPRVMKNPTNSFFGKVFYFSVSMKNHCRTPQTCFILGLKCQYHIYSH